MKILDYQPDHLATLTRVYNDLTHAVPHCYPVDASDLAATFAGSDNDDDRPALDAQAIFVAEADGRPVGFVHVGEGRLREGGLTEVDGIIRFLAYPRGQRLVGQALLDRAVSWVQARHLPAVTAFPQTYRYPFYGYAHTYVSSFLAHIQALFLFNGFGVSGGEVYLDWPDFDPAPPRPVSDLAFDVVVERTASRGQLPDIRVNAIHADAPIGECLLWSASRFSRAAAVESFAFCQWLGVDAPYQGKGIGAHLLGRALQEAKMAGYRDAGISTAFDNHRALLFYANFGFQAVDWTRRFRRVFEEESG